MALPRFGSGPAGLKFQGPLLERMGTLETKGTLKGHLGQEQSLHFKKEKTEAKSGEEFEQHRILFIPMWDFHALIKEQFHWAQPFPNPTQESSQNHISGRVGAKKESGRNEGCGSFYYNLHVADSLSEGVHHHLQKDSYLLPPQARAGALLCLSLAKVSYQKPFCQVQLPNFCLCCSLLSGFFFFFSPKCR